MGEAVPTNSSHKVNPPATMLKTFHALPLLIAGAILAVVPSAGQEFVLQSESTLSVDGTSNTGDWKVHATTITGTMTMAEVGAPQSVNVTIPSADMKGRNMLMTKNMGRTLKVAEHSKITYTLTEVSDSSTDDDGTFTLSTTGNLTLGGETRQISMTVTGTTDDDGRVHLEGSHSLLMSDYNLTERQFMFGRFVLSDEVKVSFAVQFAPVE